MTKMQNKSINEYVLGPRLFVFGEESESDS